MLTHTKPLPGAKSRELEELQLCPCCSLLPHALRFTQNLLPNDNPELMREKSKRLTHMETSGRRVKLLRSRGNWSPLTGLMRSLPGPNTHKPLKNPSQKSGPEEPLPAAYAVVVPSSPSPARSQVRRVHSGEGPPCCPQSPHPPVPPLGSWFRVTPPKEPLPRPSRLLHTLRERCDSRPSTHPLRSRARTTSPLPAPRSPGQRQVSASLSHPAQPPAVGSFGWHLEPSQPCDPGLRARPQTWL